MGCYRTVLLIKMGLRNISSTEETNRYLGEEFIEVHNKQFGKAAKDPQNGHRLLNSKEDLKKSWPLEVKDASLKALAFNIIIRSTHSKQRPQIV